MDRAPSELRLHLQPDTDGTGELFAWVVSGDFSGAGSAWFHLQELEAFGIALRDTFPFQAGSDVRLAGGHWARAEAGAAVLKDLHLGLWVYAIDTTGSLGVRVELTMPERDGQRLQSRRSVALELTTDHETLRVFGNAVCAMARGSADRAILRTILA